MIECSRIIAAFAATLQKRKSLTSWGAVRLIFCSAYGIQHGRLECIFLIHTEHLSGSISASECVCSYRFMF